MEVMRWAFYWGAVAIAASIMVLAGAPLFSVFAGAALAGVFNWVRTRRAR